MSKKSQNKLNKFIKELGRLISIKISSYHKKYNNGIETSFINPFIYCPYEGEFGTEFIRSAARTRQRFEEHLHTELFDIGLNCIGLTKNRDIEYSFHCDIYFAKKEDGELLEFTLVGQVINLENQESLQYLNNIDDEIFDRLLVKIKKLIKNLKNESAKLTQSPCASFHH